MKTKQVLRFKYLILISIVATSLLGGSFAYAEEDMEDYFSMSPAELAEIPVAIATGTPKPVFRSAGSISVVTEDQIKSMGATELYEVVETIPGIHVSLDPITQLPVYSVRGIANQRNSQMLMLMDGTRISTPFNGTVDFGPSFPLAAVQRVEVIRGPGSAVHGADAFAGVINIITKKASDIKGGQVGVRAGNWNTQSGWGQYGTSLGDWNIAANIQYQGTDGDNGRIIPLDYQTSNDILYGTRASHAPGAMNTLYKSINTHVNLQNKYWDIGFWANNILNSGMRAGSGGSLDPNGKADGAQYLGDFRFSSKDLFKDWELLAHLSYLNSDTAAKNLIFPANSILPVDEVGDISPNIPVATPFFPDGAIDIIDYTQRVPSLELTSLYKGLEGHQLRLSAGFRYEDILVNSHLSNYGKGIIDGVHPPNIIDGKLTDVTGSQYAFINNTHRTVWSTVLQDEWQIDKDWLLTAGVRYDHYSDFGETVNPRFALAWDINKALTAKLLYGRAFRAPTFYESALQNNPTIDSNRNLKPENINTVEMAFDYRPFSTFRSAVNLFYYNTEALIVPQKQGREPFKQKYNNSGEQDGYGSELEWNWQFTNQWSFFGNYSWQRSLQKNEFTDSKVKVPGAPEHQLYAALKWQFLPQWQFQTQLNWIGGRGRELDLFRGNNDKLRLQDSETVDFTLRGAKLWGHVNFAASLRNAFDDQNFEPAFRPNYPSNYPLPGRSFYLETSVDF
jgi:outer membrane receptor protein involved in Fe transport